MKRTIFTVVLGLWFASSALAAPVFVDGVWLEKQLANPKLVVVDMSDDDTQYLRFHLPGAVRLPYDVLVKERKNDKVKVRLDDAELTRVLGRLGIARDSQVVIYDDMGGLNAARLFWELERLGHREVSVLDGGLVRWILDGRKVVNNARAARRRRRGVSSSGVVGAKRRPAGRLPPEGGGAARGGRRRKGRRSRAPVMSPGAVLAVGGRGFRARLCAARRGGA